MKLDATTKIWLGSTFAAALAILICAPLRASGVLGEWTLLFAFFVSIVLLFLLAMKLAGAKPRLNLTIAAESSVALGIFSLILSIAVALYGVSDFMTEIAKRDLTIDDIHRFTVPFIEGLVAAALAHLAIRQHDAAAFTGLPT